MTNSFTEYISWRDILARTTDATKDKLVAKWLCEHAAGVEGSEFTSILDELVNERSGIHLAAMVARFVSGEPIQYVMGRWAFRHLDLMVDGRVLIPRPETELLVDIVKGHAMQRSRDYGRPVVIADLGTGSGALGLSLLHELPLGAAEVWMTDESEDALHVARANGVGIGRAASGARFAQGSWYDALPTEYEEGFDIVVSNPPYIANDDPEVDDAVLQYEPKTALFAGPDGLEDIRVIVSNASKWLMSGGLLAVEIGHTQGDSVSDLFIANGFSSIEIHKDLSAHNRFVSGIKPNV
jgi:release factor glutamine methyltransferase